MDRTPLLVVESDPHVLAELEKSFGGYYLHQEICSVKRYEDAVDCIHAGHAYAGVLLTDAVSPEDEHGLTLCECIAALQESGVQLPILVGLSALKSTLLLELLRLDVNDVLSYPYDYSSIAVQIHNGLERWHWRNAVGATRQNQLFSIVKKGDSWKTSFERNLTRNDADVLRRELLRQLDAGGGLFQFDLTKVREIDAHCLHIFCSFAKLCEQQLGCIAVVIDGINHQLADFFSDTGFLTNFPITLRQRMHYA